jgi:hypothetical protein
MNSRARWVTFLLLIASFSGFSQKVKYKDLFVLLNAKQYENAEPFLKKYLRENTDNPNAYLFMGIIYQDKAAKMDYLKQTVQLANAIDSAVYFYDKAKKGITEKELSRNDEYYQMYNRRDLRTGKFGVTLSDVQLDLENRMKLKERRSMIVALRYQFDAAQAAYKRAAALFRKIQETYPGQKELLLRADDHLITELTRLANTYDSCHLLFNDYKSTASNLGKTGYNQDLDPVEIQDFKKDGATEVDFFKDDLRVWDYKRWALATEETIEKEITPLKEQLTSLDAEISKVHEKLKKDSVSIRAEIAALQAKNKFPALRKIEPQPMPEKLFEMRISELVYGTQVAEDKVLKDSSVSRVLGALRKELALAHKIDSLASLVAEINLAEAGENYKQFVTSAYGTTEVLKTQINSTREYGIREVVRKENEIKRRTESLKWISAAPDSIPMFKEVPAASPFRPLVIVDGKFTAGLKFVDSLATGYAIFVNSTQVAESRADFPVDQTVFKKRNLPFTKSLITNDKEQLYFVMFYSEAKVKDSFPATLAKVQRGQPLVWSVNYLFEQPPVELIYSPETADLAVRTKSATGEVFGIVFDKNGKVVK